MASLVTSHASIGDSTLKDARDLTVSSFGGPEDFTLNLLDHMRRNKPNFKRSDREETTHSSLSGPEDFTANISRYINHNKADDSSQCSNGRVIAPLRRASKSVKTTQHSPPRSTTHSPNHRTTSPPLVVGTKSDTMSQSRKGTSPRSETSTRQSLAKAHNSKKPVKETNNNTLKDDNNANISIIIKDGNVYHKTIRAAARQQMQPSVSDVDEENGPSKEDIITAPPAAIPSNDHQSESTTSSLSLPVPPEADDDDLTEPLGESTPTPTQRTVNSTTSSSKETSTLEDAFDFATSLAHRIQRTPVSAKKSNPEADVEALDADADADADADGEYTINLSANASELLTEGIYRAETFPRNDSFVRNCSDPNVAFADRIRAIRPNNNAHSTVTSTTTTTTTNNNNASTSQRPPAQRKDDETEFLRQQLEQLKARLAQRDETINVLQTKLSAKETECEELHNGLLREKRATAEEKARGEEALKDAVCAAEENAAERFAIVKDALIVAEEEAVVASERARDAVVAAEGRCARLEETVTAVRAAERAARVEAKRARKEQAQREALWVQRSEVLLAECERRGRALMLKVGEMEMPGVKDERGRQAYRYQNQNQRGRGEEKGVKGRMDVGR